MSPGYLAVKMIRHLVSLPSDVSLALNRSQPTQPPDFEAGHVGANFDSLLHLRFLFLIRGTHSRHRLVVSYLRVKLGYEIAQNRKRFVWG